MSTAATMNALPKQERRVDDQWKSSVDTAIRVLKDGQSGLQLEIAENTKITKRVEKAVADHAQRVQPLVDTWDSAQDGLATLGKIGRAGSWCGRKVVRFGTFVVICVAGWLFLKHIIAGDGMEAALEAFHKAVGGK